MSFVTLSPTAVNTVRNLKSSVTPTGNDANIFGHAVLISYPAVWL